jgi:hypothetical protein
MIMITSASGENSPKPIRFQMRCLGVEIDRVLFYFWTSPIRVYKFWQLIEKVNVTVNIFHLNFAFLCFRLMTVHLRSFFALPKMYSFHQPSSHASGFVQSFPGIALNTGLDGDKCAYSRDTGAMLVDYPLAFVSIVCISFRFISILPVDCWLRSSISGTLNAVVKKKSRGEWRSVCIWISMGSEHTQRELGVRHRVGRNLGKWRHDTIRPWHHDTIKP